MKIGIVGTGRIAKRFVPELKYVDGTEVTAVYNPRKESAERFTDALWDEDAPAATSDLDLLLDRTEAVYIASPHETHFGYIRYALEHGKHVLCEKPMVLDRSRAEECFRLAGEKRLVLMEGLKTAWCPGYRKLIEIALSGIIGDVKCIESCFTKLEDSNKRELTDRSYGGSFTELGSYVMLPILDLFGSSYKSLRFSSIDNELGLDIFTKADLEYSGKIASADCGLGVKAEGRLMIAGTKGYISVLPPWWKTTDFEIHFEDPGKTQCFRESFEGDGLRYEISEFVRRIRENDFSIRCAEMDRSVIMAGLMEQFLKNRTQRDA